MRRSVRPFVSDQSFGAIQRCRQNDFSLVFGRTTNDELYSTLVSRRSKDLVEAALKESNGHVLHRPIVTCGQNMVERIRSIPEARSRSEWQEATGIRIDRPGLGRD